MVESEPSGLGVPLPLMHQYPGEQGPEKKTAVVKRLIGFWDFYFYFDQRKFMAYFKKMANEGYVLKN